MEGKRLSLIKKFSSLASSIKKTAKEFEPNTDLLKW
jgi:hypothetical protein